MKGKVASILLLLVLLISSSGCAINRATASLSPGAGLSNIKKFYLIQTPDDRDTCLLIEDNLRKRGYAVITGSEMPLPYKADAVVTYVDKWTRDIIMYMEELTITLRDPTNDYLLAVGNSMHTYLTRKSPEEMVDEVLTNIFDAKPSP